MDSNASRLGTPLNLSVPEHYCEIFIAVADAPHVTEFLFASPQSTLVNVPSCREGPTVFS
jgi:hypothetical protein